MASNYGNPGPEEDLYSDGPSASQSEPQEKGAEAEDEGEETAILPKSILVGKEFKPGDELVLKVLAIHEDSVSVAYAHEETPHKEEPEAKGPESKMAGGDSEMADLMA